MYCVSSSLTKTTSSSATYLLPSNLTQYIRILWPVRRIVLWIMWPNKLCSEKRISKNILLLEACSSSSTWSAEHPLPLPPYPANYSFIVRVIFLLPPMIIIYSSGKRDSLYFCWWGGGDYRKMLKLTRNHFPHPCRKTRYFWLSCWPERRFPPS